MEASTRIPTLPLSFEPNTEKIKRNLLKKGVSPTPKIVHTLRKKEIQKFNRKSKKVLDKTPEKPLSEAQKQEISEESHFQTIKHEYRTITKLLKGRNEEKDGKLMVGKPWERLERSGLRELASGSKEYGGEKLKGEHLLELRDILEKRNHAEKHWLLDEDIEEGEWMETGGRKEASPKRQLDDAEAIQFLVKRLSAMNLTTRDWKFPKLMKQSGLHFTELHLLRIVEGLGAAGCWRHALSVVEWIYNCSQYKYQKSRFVYTKLLAVLGKSRKPMEALRIYNLMLEDCRIYPDLAAYHCISVTLGQAGLVKDLVNVIERMRKTPSNKVKNTRSKNWDPCLEPDVVVYNAVLNACVSSHQWKGVSWVMEEMRKSGLKPNGATYGLAMEVMLRSGKYDLVHKFFEKMRRSGAGPKAITYKVLVRAFWEEGKINEAIEAVRDMERRGVVGTASVYYELACCLCKNGRWKEAIVEVENLKKLRLTKPLEVTFTGMIISCMEGGHIQDSISLFHQMNHHCSPNIGTINAMLKIYGQNDMFLKAKELFETTKETNPSSPDAFTYTAILEASSNAQQWEYFEYLYKEMALRGYQINQDRHSWLLVEASKAGKGHLLEHAFDTILEAGEIPCLSFFVQMVCEAITKLNYERAVNLLNSMAHASFCVSEKQWTEFLIGISKDKLECLFDRLSNSDVKKEVTISNLLKSIESTCGTDSIDLVAFCGESEDQVDSVVAKCVEYGSSDSESFGEVEDSVDKTLELLTGGEGFSRAELPQASEILKNWRESRNKDGIFLPFQYKSSKD